MESYQLGQVEMFVNITGASEADARDKLRAFQGDLNAAIDSYLSEKENPVPPGQFEEADLPVWEDENGRPRSQRITSTPFYPSPIAPAWRGGQRRVGGLGLDGSFVPSFPFRGALPIVSQPRDVREIPIDWKDGESRGHSSPGLIIEEIPATVEESPRSQRPAHFITEAEEDAGSLTGTFKNGGDGRSRSTGNNIARGFLGRRTNLDAPLSPEVSTIVRDESDDFEDILRTVIEASERETRGIGANENLRGAGHLEAEDDDFARAVSLSLKSAEQEKAVREGKTFPWFSEAAAVQGCSKLDDREKFDISKGDFRRDASSARAKSSMPLLDEASDAPAGSTNSVLRDQAGNGKNIEEQSLRKRQPGSFLNPTVTSPDTTNSATSQNLGKEPSKRSGKAEHTSELNGSATDNNEWAGLSSEEQEEAVMLEAAMFGSLPDNIAVRLGYPSVVGRNMEGTDGDFSGYRGSHISSRPVQQPSSPTAVAERGLREQQDEEYIASLVADREKDERTQLEEEARRLKEVEAKVDAQAKDLRKGLAEELQKQVAARQTALPEEPSIDDDSAVTIMVRMPDGTRHGRRFYKSDSLQCLRDFIDVSCGSLPGSYRLVRPYPRRAFSDAEHRSSFHELGMDSRYETLFLELV